MVLKEGADVGELNELEEMIENEINRLFKKGATLEESAEAGALLAKKYWKEKNANKSRC